MKLKRVTIKVNGTDHKLHAIPIMPGITPGDVPTQLNLEDFVLALPDPAQLLSVFEE